MEQDLTQIPLYQEHAGTIKIAGSTLPKGAGKCAYHYLQKQNLPIDFMVIGANANQQATKAMGVFRFMVDNDVSMRAVGVAFQPYHYKTVTEDGSGKREKSVTVWRTVIFHREQANAAQG